MRLIRTYKSLGLNPPPSAEANLSSRCLSAKTSKRSTADRLCMFATEQWGNSRIALKRSATSRGN